MTRHARGLHGLILGTVRNPQDADDLTQEAFFRAYRYLSRFQSDRSFRPWLYRIGLNLAFTHLRRSRSGRWLHLDEADPETGRTPLERLADPDAEARVTRSAEVRGLEDAWESLPPLYRSILNLRVVQGLHYEEIAEVLGIPQGTVMSRLSRARAALRGALDPRRGAGSEVARPRSPAREPTGVPRRRR